METHFHYISASSMQAAAGGNKEEKNWKYISGIFPLRRDIQEPKPKALGMVSFNKMFSGGGNNPPNKTRTITEKTPNKTKRETSTRQTLDRRETSAGQRLDKSRIKARFFPLAAIK